VGADHQEGRRLCRLKCSVTEPSWEQAGHCPGLFFAHNLLYKARYIYVWVFIHAETKTMIRSAKDFCSGLIYICLGSSAMIIARDYSLGTAVKMGPAYFPTILGGLLVLIGTISVIRSFIVTGTPIGAFAFKGLSLVIGSTLLFGLLVRGAGLIVALPLLVIISAYASTRFRWGPTIVMTLGLTLFCVLVFIKGLGIPLPIIGSWFGG
jgi:hypothetical protein